MTRKIAILSVRSVEYSYDYDNYGSVLIANSITDWEEVSDEDYDLLWKASNQFGKFKIVEQIQNQKEFIAKSIKDYKTFAKAEADRAEKEKKIREEAALERKFKKELKDQKSKEKMLAKLIDELGPDALKRAANIS